jgi:hypothetical protein
MRSDNGFRGLLAAVLLGLLTGNTLVAQPPDRNAEKLPALLAAKPLAAVDGDDDLQKLLKARYNEVAAELAGRYRQLRAGVTDVESLFDPAQRLLQTGLELHGKPADRIALLNQFLEFTRMMEQAVKARVDAGVAPMLELNYVRYFRIDAETQLLRAKREVEKGN